MNINRDKMLDSVLQNLPEPHWFSSYLLYREVGLWTSPSCVGLSVRLRAAWYPVFAPPHGVWPCVFTALYLANTQGNLPPPHADLWISFSASFFPGLCPANCHHLSLPDLKYLFPDLSDIAMLYLDSPSTCCCPASAPMLEGRVPRADLLYPFSQRSQANAHKQWFHILSPVVWLQQESKSGAGQKLRSLTAWSYFTWVIWHLG